MREKNTAKVVIFILWKNDKILIEKRYIKNFTDLQYLIPGGEVEKLESAEQALKREIMEELGITVFSHIPLPTPEIRGLDNQILIPFLITGWEGNIPNSTLDKKDPLIWLTMSEVLETGVKPTKKIVEALKKYLSL